MTRISFVPRFMGVPSKENALQFARPVGVGDASHKDR